MNTNTDKVQYNVYYAPEGGGPSFLGRANGRAEMIRIRAKAKRDLKETRSIGTDMSEWDTLRALREFHLVPQDRELENEQKAEWDGDIVAIPLKSEPVTIKDIYDKKRGDYGIGLEFLMLKKQGEQLSDCSVTFAVRENDLHVYYRVPHQEVAKLGKLVTGNPEIGFDMWMRECRKTLAGASMAR